METEVNVRLSALSNHQHGGLGSWTYEVGERTRKWSRTDHWKFKWREWEHKERSRHEYDCMCMSVCGARSAVERKCSRDWSTGSISSSYVDLHITYST